MPHPLINSVWFDKMPQPAIVGADAAAERTEGILYVWAKSWAAGVPRESQLHRLGAVTRQLVSVTLAADKVPGRRETALRRPGP